MKGRPVEEEDVVGLRAAARLRSWRADDHAGNGKPPRLGLFREQALTVGGGHMAFDRIAFGLGRMTGTQLVRNAAAPRGRSDVLDGAYLDLEARLPHMLDPMFCSSRRWRLGDHQGRCCRASGAAQLHAPRCADTRDSDAHAAQGMGASSSQSLRDGLGPNQSHGRAPAG